MEQSQAEQVRSRAHAIWEREGRPEGGAERHWAMAEAELGRTAVGMTNPGDEAPPGTPGTGEDICPTCNGTGQREGKMCPDCGGSGKVVEGIGGA